MHIRRPVLVSSFVATAMILTAGSASAWCSPFIDSSTSMAVTPNQAPAGTWVTVSGTNWAPGPVEAHWGSPSGRLLGKTGVGSDQSFSMEVQIPAVAPGQHSIVVFHTGSVPSQKTAAFEVFASGLSPANDDQGGSTGGTTSGRVGVSPGAADAATPAAGSADAPAPVATLGMPTGTEPATGGEASSVARAGAATGGARSAVPAQRGSLAAAITGAPVSAQASAPAAEQGPAAAPPSRSALNDLWGGFAARSDASPAAGLAGTEGPGTSGSGAGIPLLVLTLGVLSLFAGFAIAELSRRRATATVPGRG